jgi:hypothetical protein
MQHIIFHVDGFHGSAQREGEKAETFDVTASARNDVESPDDVCMKIQRCGEMQEGACAGIKGREFE